LKKRKEEEGRKEGKERRETEKATSHRRSDHFNLSSQGSTEGFNII